MPIYEYRCLKCGERFETFKGISQSDKEVLCPKCGEKSPSRVLSSFFNSNGCGRSGNFTFPT